MSSYSDKLKDPRWQKKRLQILNRDGWQCRLCGNDKNHLQVHHRIYERGKEPWDYDDGNFVTLCEQCHDKIESDKLWWAELWDVKEVFETLRNLSLLFQRHDAAAVEKIIDKLVKNPTLAKQLCQPEYFAKAS
jgi:hypothetical protein